MKHPTKDHSLFSIDIIDELVEEYMQISTGNADFSNFFEISNVMNCFNPMNDVSDFVNISHIQDLFDSEDNIVDLAYLVHIFEFSDLTDLVCRCDGNPECPRGSRNDSRSQSEAGSDSRNPESKQVEAESDSGRPSPHLDRVGQPILTLANKFSLPHSPSNELNPLPDHLKKHKKAIGWTLVDHPRINPSICMHKILLEEEARPLRQLNPTNLNVVKKEVMRLLVAGIIYLISDSQWVSMVQVVPKKSRMTVIKNRIVGEFVSTTRSSIKRLAMITFLCLSLTSIRRTFTCPFDTFAYTRIPFGLFNVPSTLQRCMISIFSNLLEDYMEVFMDDFTMYAESFEACLENLSRVLSICMETNLTLNFEKCHFMVIEGIVLGHLKSNRGIEVDKAKVDIITSLPNPVFVREVHSFLEHAGFYKRFIKNFSKIALPLSKLLQKDVDFVFDQPCVEAFLELKKRLTSIPIL
ncbi:Retrovirus-related Pol polyprotein from transposon 17.6, partial [Mucuna pruriens]